MWVVAGDHLAFGVWTLWPVMALFMPRNVYGFSAADEFLLGATATLVGAGLPIPYSLGLVTFGGRRWTAFSVANCCCPPSEPSRYWLIPGCRCGRICCARR